MPRKWLLVAISLHRYLLIVGLNPCTNQMTGSGYHLLNQILWDMSIDATFLNPKPFSKTIMDETMADIRRNAFDALFAVEVSAKFPSMALSTEPIILGRIAAVYLKNKDLEFSSSEDLKGLKGVTPVSNNNDGVKVIPRWAKQKGLNLSIIESKDSAIKSLFDNKADYVIMGYYRAKADIKEELLDQLEVVSIDELKHPLYFGILESSNWKKYLPEINQRIADARNSGLIERLNITYLKQWVNEKGCKK